MKILITGQAFYQRNNGQAVFTINLAEGLAAAGHKVLVLAPSETGNAYRKQEHGVQIQTVPALHLQNNVNISAFSGRLVRRVLAEFAPEIVHIQDHYFLSRSVVRATNRQQAKLIGTNHFLPENLTDNAPLPTWLAGMAHPWLWDNLLALYNQLDGVTAPTQTAVNILRTAGLNVPTQAISCGINSERFHPRPELDRSTLRQQYKLGADKTLLLYVGRVDQEKSLESVIKAMAHLKRNDVQFAIAGKGRHLSALKTLCQKLQVGERVVFTGFVPDDDLPLLLNSADIFVMPGYAELQSIATLEAMASGLPVLAADARALPELVDHNHNGYLFIPKSPMDVLFFIVQLLNNRSAWANMGAASLHKAQMHAQRNTTQRYVDWYSHLRPVENLGRQLQPQYTSS